MNAKKIIMLIMSIVLIWCIIDSKSKNKIREIEITYCDGRPSKIIYLECDYEPNNRNIYSYRHIPEFAGELNVCEVRTLRTIK